MRCSYLSILLLTSLLLSAAGTAQAQRRQGRRASTPAWQSTARPQPQQPTPAGGEVSGNEQQMMAKIRSYQAQLEREEKVLSQRMAYAAQLRRQGLEKKDQRLLDQAEQYERKALAAYQGRVKLFEKTNLNPGSGERVPTAVKNSPSTTRPQPRQRSSRKRSSRSSKSAWSWLR